MRSVLDNKTTNVYENHTVTGYWWLPSQEGEPERFPGTLHYSPEHGGVLEVLGEMQPFSNSHEFHEPLDVICGFSSKGEEISLLRASGNNFEISFPGIPRQKFTSSLVVAGLHCSSESELKFKKLRVRYTHLDGWAGKRGIERAKTEGGGTTVNYEFPQPVQVRLREGFSISVDFATWSGGEPDHFESFSIRQFAYITFESETERSFADFRDLAMRFRDFLTLSVGKPVYILEWVGRSEASVFPTDGKDKMLPIRVFERPYAIHGEVPRVEQRNMLLPLSAIEHKLESVLNSWMTQAQELGYVLSLYFGTLYDDAVYRHRHFLSLAQAAEAYHRRTTDEKVMAEGEHEKLVALLLNAVPEERREWLKPRLQFTNEIGFRRRMGQLYDRVPSLFKDHFKRSGFKNSVTEARNCLTHIDMQAEAKVMRMNLVELILQLRSVMEANLLADIGLSDGEITDAMNQRLSQRAMGWFV